MPTHSLESNEVKLKNNQISINLSILLMQKPPSFGVTYGSTMCVYMQFPRFSEKHVKEILDCHYDFFSGRAFCRSIRESIWMPLCGTLAKNNAGQPRNEWVIDHHRLLQWRLTESQGRQFSKSLVRPCPQRRIFIRTADCTTTSKMASPKTAPAYHIWLCVGRNARLSREYPMYSQLDYPENDDDDSFETLPTKAILSDAIGKFPFRLKATKEVLQSFTAAANQAADERWRQRLSQAMDKMHWKWRCELWPP